MAEREAPIVLTDLEGEGSDSNLAYVCETHENVLMSIMRVESTGEGLSYSGDVFDNRNSSYELSAMGANAVYSTEKQRELVDITYVSEDELPVEGAEWDYDMNGDIYRKDPTGKMITVYRYLFDLDDREICIEVSNPLTPEQGQRIAEIVKEQ